MKVHLAPKNFSILDKFSYYQEYMFKNNLIWLNPQLSVIFLAAENPARIDTILVQVWLKKQSGGMGQVASIPKAIFYYLSEIHIISLVFTDCFLRKCLQFALLLIAENKKTKFKVYRCT